MFIATQLNPVEISPNDTNIEHVCGKVTGDELAFNITVTSRPPG